MLKKTMAMILLCLPLSCFSHPHTIALTIDDLPFVGEEKNFHLSMIIKALTEQHVPATGFVIAGAVSKNNWPLLHQCREAGLALGNHTMTHANLNKIGAEAYIQDIDAADKRLSPVLSRPKYFRYPYLVMGTGQAKDHVMQYLADKHYHIAPVTIDSKDFVFNQLLLAISEKERRAFLTILKPCYLAFLWQQTLQAEARTRNTPEQAQILLIHSNLLNAYVLPDLITLYRQQGYHFVSLKRALQIHHAPPAVETLPDELNEDPSMMWN